MSIARTPRTGALSILAGGFVLSAVLRTGDVVAALPFEPDDGFGNRIAVTSDPEGDASGATSLIPDTETLIAELQERSKLLAERETALDARAAELREVEERLRVRLEELENARLDLESQAGKAATAARDDVRHLAEMYQTMKPKQAGRIFNEMEPSFAAGFLGELRSDVAALILSNMEPERAYAVSLLLAGRNLEQVGAGSDR